MLSSWTYSTFPMPLDAMLHRPPEEDPFHVATRRGACCSASPSVGAAASFSERCGARSSGRAIAGVALRWALSSSRTAFHLPKVVEPVRMSTTTSKTAPLTKVTYLAWPGGADE